MKGLYKRDESIAQIAQSLADTIGRNLVCHTVVGASGQAADQKRIFVAPCECIVKKVYLITETDDAKDGTNFWAFKVVNVTDSEDLSSAVTTNEDIAAGVAITGDTPYEITVDQNNKLDALDVLELDLAIGGTPTELAELSIIVIYSFDEDDEA